MANIIWSFGIALQAQDEASETISEVLGLINQLDESLNRLEGRSGTTNVALNSLGTEAVGVAAKATGGFGLAAASLAEMGSTAVSTMSSLAKSGAQLLEAVGKTTLSVVWGGVKGLLTSFDSMLGLTTKGALGLVNALQSVPDTISHWVFGRGIDDLQAQFTAAHNAVREFIDLGAEFYPLDQALRRIALHSVNGAVSVQQLSDRLLSLSLKSGVSMGQFTDLATAISHTGGNIGSLVAKTSDATGKLSKLEILGHLADTFGLGAEGAAQFDASMRRLGGGVTDVANKAAEFETTFGIPGLMQTLPGVTKHATDAISRFGKAIVGDEKKIIENTLKAGATFSKAFGKDINEATAMAVDSFSHFSDALESSQDVMLGLRDAFSPLQTALFQYGASFEQTQQLLKQGRDDPLAFAQNIRKMAASMDPMMARRFISQMSKELPEGIRNLVRNENDLKNAIAARNEAQEMSASQGGQAFEKLTTSMRDNARDAMQIFENIKGTISAAFGLLFADDIRVVFQNLVGGAKTFATQLREQVKTLTSNPEFNNVRESLRSIVTALVGMGEASGMASKVVGVVLTLGGLLTPIATALKLIQGAIGAMGPKGELSFGGIVKGVFKSIIGIETLSETFDDLKAVMGGSAKGWDKFVAVGKTILVGFVNYVNKLFFGLPGQFVTQFTFGAQASRYNFGEALMVLFDKGREKIRAQLVEWRNEFLKSDFTGTLGAFGRNIGAALGNITKTVADWVRGLFDDKKRAELMTGLTGLFVTSTTEKDSITSSLVDIAGHAFSGLKALATEFADSFLASFGTNLELMFGRLKLSFNNFALNAESAFDTLVGAFYTAQEVAVPVLKVISGIMSFALDTTLTLSEAFVVFLTGVVKASAYIQSALGVISKETRDAAVNEAAETGDKILRGLNSAREKVGGVDKYVQGIDLSGLEAKRQGLADRETARDKTRIELARDERLLRGREALFKDQREAIVTNKPSMTPNQKLTDTPHSLMDMFRQAAAAKQAGGALPVSLPPTDKPGVEPPTRTRERVTIPAAATSGAQNLQQQVQMLEEFKKFLRQQQLQGKITVELKGDELTKQFEAFVKSKP